MREQDRLCKEMLKLITIKDEKKFKELLADYSLVMMRIGKKMSDKNLKIVDEYIKETSPI